VLSLQVCLGIFPAPKPLKAMASDGAKKPASAYFLWMNATREEIQNKVGSKDFGVVAKKASEMWANISAAAKKPFEDKAKAQKDAFEKFKATPEGQKALEEKKAERKDKQDDKVKKDGKKAAKSVEKDEKLKKPTTAYFLFMNAKREEIQKLLNTKDFGPVTKKAVEMWKNISEKDRKPFDDEAKAQRDAYDKYVKSPEGMKVLEAYKEEVKIAKGSVKRAPETEGDAPAEKQAKKAKAGA